MKKKLTLIIAIITTFALGVFISPLLSEQIFSDKESCVVHYPAHCTPQFYKRKNGDYVFTYNCKGANEDRFIKISNWRIFLARNFLNGKFKLPSEKTIFKKWNKRNELKVTCP